MIHCNCFEEIDSGGDTKAVERSVRVSGQRVTLWARGLTWLVVTLALVAVAACEEKASSADVTYKPVLLPLKFSVGPAGVSVSGDTSIVTPIGEFSIGAKYSLAKAGRGAIYVIIRDRTRGASGYDQIFEVRTGVDQLTAVVNGKTTIQIKDGQVLIDVSSGSIKSIEFAKVPQAAAVQQESGFSAWWNDGVAKWDRGWESSFYKPFMLTRAAYDDSTVGRWYGLGAVWFMLRLTLAVIFAIVDLVLSAVFLLAQAAYWFFGDTGKNIVWGIAALPLFWFVVVRAARFFA